MMSFSTSAPQKSPGQVWWMDQAKSREVTDPQQPLDPVKPKRMFCILAPPHSNEVTCAPVLTLKPGKKVKLTEVELSVNRYKWLQNDSYVACHQIVTVPEDVFKGLAGSIGEMDKVKQAIKTHLRIT